MLDQQSQDGHSRDEIIKVEAALDLSREGLKAFDRLLEALPGSCGDFCRTGVGFQLLDSLTERLGARLKVHLADEAVLVGIQQPFPRLLIAVDQLTRKRVVGRCRLSHRDQTLLALPSQALRVGQQCDGILPDDRLEMLGSDRATIADPCAAPLMGVQSCAAIVAVTLPLPDAGMVHQRASTLLTEDETLQQVTGACRPEPGTQAVLLETLLRALKQFLINDGRDWNLDLFFSRRAISGSAAARLFDLAFESADSRTTRPAP
ncbi:MAG: hypothetical protein M3552_13195 [Planctomycetota bacterium]|nr:hypothetical protein [Planctomycetota bacterium]